MENSLNLGDGFTRHVGTPAAQAHDGETCDEGSQGVNTEKMLYDVQFTLICTVITLVLSSTLTKDNMVLYTWCHKRSDVSVQIVPSDSCHSWRGELRAGRQARQTHSVSASHVRFTSFSASSRCFLMKTLPEN